MKSYNARISGFKRPLSLRKFGARYVPPPLVSYDEHTLTRGVQLAIHRGPAAIEDYGIQNRSGSTALQYKLEESGAVYHIKGLGEGLI